MIAAVPGPIQGNTGGSNIQSGSNPQPQGPTTVPTTPADTPPSGTGPSSPYTYYDNYGTAEQGIPLCRGNPNLPNSMPGGTVTQTFTATATGTITSAKVQIDPSKYLTAHATLFVNGTPEATNDETVYTGDVMFTFTPVNITSGDLVALTITFTATQGQITTVYLAGDPGGSFTVTNTCPNAPDKTASGPGLRAVITGTT